MSNMTPFEIRLELLKMAKDMLSEDYYGKREAVSNDWGVKVEAAKINGEPVPAHPGFSAYPSEADIIAKARILNEFVSNVAVETKQTRNKSA